MFSIQGLKNSTVFTVYRKNLYSIFFCHWNDQMPCSYQSFLIGKCNVLSCTDRLDRRANPKHSHDCSNQNFCIRHGSQLQKAIHSCDNLRIRILNLLCKFLCRILIPDSNQTWRKFSYLFFQFLNIFSCTDSKNLNITIGTHNIQCLCSDRSCGS